MAPSTDAVRDYYELYWSAGGVCPPTETTPELAELLGRHLVPGTRVIDVGCGDGGTAGAWIQAHGCAYVGVDVSETAVRVARERGLDARVIENAKALPFEDGSFDAAVCLDVFEHLFEPELVAADIARVLRPGGLLIAATPNVAYWRRRIELAVFGRFNPYGSPDSMRRPWRDPHLRFFTGRTLRAMLETVGFETARTAGFHGALCRDIPHVRSLTRGRPSRAYRRAERALPGLLALTIAIVARKPG
jgi:methionine biosynthesis protein MetW